MTYFGAYLSTVEKSNDLIWRLPVYSWIICNRKPPHHLWKISDRRVGDFDNMSAFLNELLNNFRSEAAIGVNADTPT